MSSISTKFKKSIRLQSTVNGHKLFVTFDFLLYISYKTTFFQKNILKLSLEEAAIFKDYMFILALFAVILPLFSYDLMSIFAF
jgi:hypothetical protein